ncbi:MAG TPA: GIY-YIG nuclease family protein [Terriglobales bacterium]|nr:GIY-YIG nuclease family protein [Terriglobales bacterium]
MPPQENENGPQGVSQDVAAIRLQIRSFLDTTDSNGEKIGKAIWGVYAFYDYDREPIYVGQTNEMLQVRIGRHLTNQRTDAVAMNVLDPFEVAEIEVWPLWELQGKDKKDREAKRILNAAEYTVFQHVLSQSSFGAVLNEGDIAPTDLIELPPSTRSGIIPDNLYEQRKHPDVRIARRATTIAALARVISERKVSKGLRRTLMTQALRLERLATQRYNEIGGVVPTVEPGEEV